MYALFFVRSRAIYALNRKAIIYDGKNLFMYLCVCVLAFGRRMCYIRLKFTDIEGRDWTAQRRRLIRVIATHVYQRRMLSHQRILARYMFILKMMIQSDRISIGSHHC